jgi:acetate kinase
MTRQIAVINAGSSSIKFAIFEDDLDQSLLFRGQVENIGVSPRLMVESPDGEMLVERQWGATDLDHGSAKIILQTCIALLGGQAVEAIGHRVVHGGTHFTGPVLANKEVLASLKALTPLAPLHQPHNLAPIEAIMSEAPHIPQVACFDTAFHQTQPPIAQAFALPREITSSGVKRYGFHGLSYEYVSAKLKEVAPGVADQRIIIAHLGNGASLCALEHGRSIASTMGFTAVDGLMMGTRCGSIDPGVLIYLMDSRGMDARAIEKLIYKESGLLGVSGISSDVRTLRASDDSRAREALSLFTYRIVREIGSLAAALGGLDGLVFTGGIGQRDPVTRREVVAGCTWLGAKLDDEANASHRERIDSQSSTLPIWVLPTDEERVIARQTVGILDQQGGIAGPPQAPAADDLVSSSVVAASPGSSQPF